jgi:NTP pyrophosphatase (non-canonical NTP hydrolase)
MHFDTYQDATEQTAIYPDEMPDSVDAGVVYTALGLVGEAGEVAEKVKKAVREDDPQYLADAEDELGDVLWYWARLCEELDADADDIAEGNLSKLLDRKQRDVLTGEGDDR